MNRRNFLQKAIESISSVTVAPYLKFMAPMAVTSFIDLEAKATITGRYYAGIGSRKTPPDILQNMKELHKAVMFGINYGMSKDVAAKYLLKGIK